MCIRDSRQLRDAGEHLAVERELLVDEGLREESGGALDGAEGQILLPGRKRLIAHERGDARARARLPDDELVLDIQPRGREESLPVEAGRAADEILARPV